MNDTKTVAVLDYGSGNVHSAVKALEAVGAVVNLTADHNQVLAADGLLVPGVGAFAAVMEQLQNVEGEALIAKRLQAAKPVLGICVGQQVLFRAGLERGVKAAGLGYFSAEVESLGTKTLPHIGWSAVEAPAASKLFATVAAEMFYFVHSNAVLSEPEIIRSELCGETVHITWAEHEGQRFIAAIEAGALSATQFHPEKSAAAGLQLLKNWVASL